MTPYYEDSAVTIYCGDCREIGPQLSPSSLTLYDPPFDIWGTVPRFPATTEVAFTNQQNRHATESALGAPRTELVWYYREGRWVSHKWPRLTHEYIYVYGRLGDAFAGALNPSAGTVIHKPQGGVGRQSLPGRDYVPRPRFQLDSVLCFPRQLASSGTCWSKPRPLIETLFRWLDPASVFDPFLGTGTSLVVAKEMGRKAIGIELDEKWCEVAAKRCQQEVLAL